MTQLPFFERISPHFQELKKRLTWTIGYFLMCFLVGFSQADQIFTALTRPLMRSLEKNNLAQKISCIHLTEAFSSSMEIAFFTALFLTIPYMEWHVWRFLSPGLTAQERKVCLTFIWGIPLLFLGGAGFCYAVILEKAFDFFVQFSNASLIVTMEDSLTFIFKIIFCFGLCFQLPLLMIGLARVGIVSATTFRENRRFVVVGIFALSAVVTPPDVLSQIGLALPLWGLYELAIRFIGK